MAKSSKNEIKKLAEKFDELFKEANQTEQPEGTITSKQYAEYRGVVPSRGQSILMELYKQVLVHRMKWKVMYVYKLDDID